MRQAHRLKTYLLAFALVLTVPLLLGSGFAIWRFSQSERLRLMSMAADAGQDIVIRVDREISTRAEILQRLASTPALVDDVTLFSQQARGIAAATGVHIVLFDPAGKQLVNTHAPSDDNLPVTSDPDLIRSVVDRRAMVYVANLFVGKISRNEQVQVAVPVLRDGKVYRIIGASILSARLVSLVSEDLMGSLSATLIDRTGIVIARSREPEIYIGQVFPGRAEQFTGDEGSVWLAGSGEDPLFAYFRRLSTSGWVVIASIPKSALDEPLFRSITILAGLIVALGAVASGSAWLIAHRLTVAHRSLIDAAAAVGDDRVVSPTITALHEVNLAAAALAAASLSVHRHAEELMQANQHLESRVRQRTEELTQKTRETESKSALFETTLDTMKQGLMVVGADGRVLFCNVQARRLLDLSDDLLDRQPLFEEISLAPAGRDDLETSGSVVEPIRLPHPRHSAKRFEMVASSGRVLEIQMARIPRDGGYVQTFSDVTEERDNHRLLQEARTAAETANSAKSDFMANMSHEMRTPLNAILGYSDLLLGKSALPPDTRRSIERIRGAGSALLGLTNDVLDLGKIEAGVIEIRIQPFALSELIDQAVSIVRPVAEGKGLVLDVQPMVPMDVLRLGDRDRLLQVLLNLLGNAVKFTAHGSVRLSVGDVEKLLRFEVADTGIGIPEADWGRLFQRFQPLDPSMTRRLGGAGLGLAISKNLAERMGGSVGFRSKVGEGSIFWVDVPLPPWPTVEANVSTDRPATGPSVRILVAEDVVVNQHLARELLESAGYAVDVVATGRAAVEAVLTHRYDLALMDVSMPEMDGLSATRLIRASQEGALRTPIVACTAHVVSSRLDAMNEAGFDAILFKPLQSDELFGTIHRILERDVEGIPADLTPPPSTGISALVSLLGQAAVLSALDTLLVDLEAFEDAAPSSRREVVELADRAHAAIATASLLGLSELMASCRTLEEACREEQSPHMTLREVRPIFQDYVKKVARLRNRLEADRKSGDNRIVLSGNG